MTELVARRPQGADPFTDLAMMVWGMIVSWAQWLDLAVLNEGLGAGVAALTIILLVYRISLAHIEITSESTYEESS